MCAIYGWIGELEESALVMMADALTHRGPDSRGAHTWDGGALGMNRLAIVDTVNGAQPFHSACGRVAVVCNGEIYNWRAIRSELESLGHRFTTQCDVEILPAAWLQWGEAMLSQLNGMFALAVRDENRDGVFIARDRCGQKPLYYATHEQGLVFASEPVGLFAAGVKRAVHVEQIPSYLLLRYVPEPETLFKGVKQLQAAHCGWLTQKGLDSRRWWSPQSEHSESTPASLASIKEAVSQSVERVCQADIPSALYLSAGIDSALLLNQLQSKGIVFKAVTAGFDDSSDECENASSLCKELQVEHHNVKCSSADLVDLPRVVQQMQVPVGDALILAFDKLAAKVSEIGCKVAFGGDGVDELFQGYSFQKMQLLAEKAGPLGRRALVAGLKLCPLPLLDKMSGFPASLGSEGKKKVIHWLANYGAASDWWKGCGLRTLFEPSEISQLMHTNVAEPSLPGTGSLNQRHESHQYQGWLQDWSIVRQDRNTMAYSVEYRMPFLDNQLIDESLKLPVSQKLSVKGGKIIWRELVALSGLKGSTSKQPFYYPVKAFMENQIFIQMLDDCLGRSTLSHRGYFDHSVVKTLRTQAADGEFIAVKKLVALVILELWHRSHIDCATTE